MSTINQKKAIYRIATLLLTLSAFAVNAFGAVAASKAPSVTTQVTLIQTLQGSNGGAAVNKFGDVFVPSLYAGKVYEFPANGSAPFAIFTVVAPTLSYGITVGGVYVDANQNLFVTATNLGSTTSTDSAIYELPYVNGSYPAPVTYTNGVPLGQCSASPTTVCAWGNFIKTAGYYYQPLDITFDGNGVGYIITAQDNNSTSSSNPSIDIYACNAACVAHTQDATILVSGLPNKPLSISADATGDIFYADGSSSIYEIAAGTTTRIPLGAGLSSTRGVRLDRAGNIFITDATGLFEIPRVNGGYSTASQIEIATQRQISQYNYVDYNGSGVAADLHGNVYIPDGYQNFIKISIANGTFGSAAVPSGTASLPFNVVFNQPTTGTTITPVGAQSGDFTASGSTCGSGGTVDSNGVTTCSFGGTFQPSGVGLRRAVLTFADASGAKTNVNVAGVGTGPAITVDPGTLTQTATGFSKAAGVAVDRGGNVFIADSTANAVYEYPTGGGPRLAVGTSLVAPVGVAADGAGNLYVSDVGGTGNNKGRVVEIPVVAGVLNSGGQITIATSLSAPKGIFVDGTGTLYVADSANANVLVLPPTHFGLVGGAVLGTGLLGPTDVVVDSSGVLYIADPTANQVIQVGVEGAQAQVGSGLLGPTGVALDASGSVIIADRGNGRLVRVPNEGGVLNPGDQISIQTAIGSPYAVRSDSSGNLVVSDNTANVLDAIKRTAGAVVFPGTNVNSTSSAQTVTLSSSGNAGLALSSPLFTAPASPFSLTQGTPACTAGTTLNPGFGCSLSAKFTPTAKTTYTTSVAFSTSALNTSSAAVTLGGTGLLLATPTVTLVQTSPTGTPTYGQIITLTATVGGTPANGGTPTGSVILVIDGSQQPAVQLVNGIATLTVTGQNGGAHIYEADYQGDTNYAATPSNQLSINITKVSSTTALAISGDAINPLSAAVGHSVTFSSVLTPAATGFFSGTVNYVSNGQVLATGTVTAGPRGSGTYLATASSNTLTAGTYVVTAVYSGNTNFTTSTSTSVTLVVVATPTIGLAPAATSITSTTGAPGSTTISVTSYAGFQGAVVFACSGLPANATCIFNPAILTLIASNTGSPASVPVLSTVLSIPISQPPLVTPTAITPWAALLLLLAFLRLRRVQRAGKMLGGSLAALLLLIGLATGLSGCGSAGFVTPNGTSTITVTATATPSIPSTAPTSSAGTVTTSFTIQLNVK
jgi:sugar lactone lactonase YvrE